MDVGGSEKLSNPVFGALHYLLLILCYVSDLLQKYYSTPGLRQEQQTEA